MSLIKANTIKPVTSGADLSLQGDSGGSAVDCLNITSAGDVDFSGNTDAKIKLPSSGGIYESDGTTPVLTESGGVVSLGSAVTGSFGSWVKLSSATASTSASVIFDNTVITSAYQNYVIIGRSIVPDSASSPYLGIQLSYDNGSNFLTIAGGARYINLTNVGGGSAGGGTGTEIITSANATNTANTGVYCDLRFYGLQTVNFDKQVSFMTCGLYGGGTGYVGFARAIKNAADSVVDHLTVKMNPGNLLTGYFTLYGVAE